MLRIPKAALVASLLLAALPAPAIQPYQPDPATEATRRMPARSFHDDALDVTPSLGLDAARDAALQARLAGFTQRHGTAWELRWDTRGDRPNVVQGSGVPLIPGRGNTLSPAAFGLTPDAVPDREQVAREGRRFIDETAELLGTRGLDLRLDEARSSAFGDGSPRWFLEYAQYHDGVRVEGAFVYLRIAHGNIVQFGAERIGEVALDATPTLTRDAAFAAAWRELGFPADTRLAETVEAGTLAIHPRLPAGEQPGMAFSGARGSGYAHLLAWRYVFRLEGDGATWQVLVDAHDGHVVDARDLTVYADATVTGGIYPTTNTDPEIVVPFPFTAVTNNGAKVTDSEGVYDYTGGTATSTLNGRYFRMSDACGSISLSNTSTGNLDFGSGSDTDCTTPGSGGAGNTHASRSGFYHLTRINEKARSILPDNSWLRTTVTANMNISQTCNASWNGSSLNFFKSGGGCSNTGEIAAVFLHEWGHGLDSNTGGAANEYGSGEAVGDTFAFLETRDSCIGPNFRPGRVCFGCTTCTGVRDVNDFSLLGSRTLATPANVTASSGINCGAYVGLTGVACPYVASNGAPYRGPMGYEGHCESYIASSANWDLAHMLIDAHGEEKGWRQMDQIWYASLTPSKSAYRVESGGQCNTAATVNGCGATNWYTVFVAADDDDGNLANGTPNACRIWDAFNAHGIACGTRPACSASAADFALAVPAAAQAVCAGTPATYPVEVIAEGGFNQPVTLAATGLPAAASASFAPNPVSPGTTSTLTIATGTATPPGSHAITVNGTAAGSPGHNVAVALTVSAPLSAPPVLQTPADGANGVATPVAFTWSAVPGATSYAIEVATDPSFDTSVANASGLVATTWTTSALSGGTTYYWRVRATNACGTDALSSASRFTTTSLVCRDLSLPIPDEGQVSDDMTISGTRLLQRLNLHIKTTHSYVGDLTYTLSHGGHDVVVIHRPGVPASTWGCDGQDIDAILDDLSTEPAENMCNATPPAIAGVLRPNQSLDLAFGGQSIGGTWTLTVADNASGDTGVLTHWCISPAFIPDYTVGGMVGGLTGTGLALQLNGGTALRIEGNGSFVFSERISTGGAYAVTIATQPVDPEQACTVASGSGTIGTTDVTDVVVTCRTDITDRLFADDFEARP